MIKNEIKDEISITTFNIFQGWNGELNEKTRWNKRYPKTISFIKENNSDIVLLQELRNLTTSDMGVEKFLSQFSPQYCFIYDHYNPTEGSMALAILYKKDRFSLLKTKKYYYYSNKKDFHLFNKETRCYLYSQFLDLKTNKVIDVVNTHLHMDEGEREKSVEILIQHFSKNKNPIIIGGDLNFFPNRGGPEQKQKILSIFKDLAYPLYRKRENGEEEEMSGTFLGMNNDKAKDEWNKMSRLDFILVNEKVIQCKKALTYVVGDEDIPERDDQLSDHFPVTININIKENID